MNASLNTMTFQNVQSAVALAVGRNIRTAARLEVTTFRDCVRNDFWWDDGACFSMLHDTPEEAAKQRESAGF